MSDDFAVYTDGIENPASNAAAITAGASPLANVTHALYIGGTVHVWVR